MPENIREKEKNMSPYGLSVTLRAGRGLGVPLVPSGSDIRRGGVSDAGTGIYIPDADPFSHDAAFRDWRVDFRPKPRQASSLLL